MQKLLNYRKCAIIGCGFVGATTAYTLIESKLFSEIVLVDIDKRKAIGEAMDMEQGLPFISPMKIYSGDYSDCADASIIIITAGANQKPGETRLDLVKTNVKIFKSIIESITAVNREAILLVVTNPVDILTYVTWKLSGFPSNRVIGSGTVLDTARLKTLVGQRLGVDSRNVHSFIIGEHGDSEFAVWSSANISGIDLDKYCSSASNCTSMETLYPLFDDVKNSAYQIIEAKGATYYAIAQAVKRICTAIVRNENSILPVSTYLDGEYNLGDICLSVPSIVGVNGVESVIEIKLDEKERENLNNVSEKLSAVICDLYSDGLI